MCNTYPPAENGSAWEFFLYINNQTGYTLEAEAAKRDWGTWYRDSVDKQGPQNVCAGESVQALGIRAAHGTATGYECRCRWSFKKDGKPIGSFDLKIDVPFSSSNSSTLTTTGLIRVEGWSDLPKKGHTFTRSITVSELGQLNSSHDLEQFLPDPDEKRYYDLLMTNNELVQNWEQLKQQVPQMESFNPISVLPENYQYPPRSIFVGRTQENVIAHNFWQDIDDPIYDQVWQKELFVDQYFSVGIYSINTDPRSTVNVPKGMEIVTENSVEVTSSITKTLKSTLSLRALLKAEYSGLAGELETTYSTENVLEESNSRVERTAQTISIGASDHNRLFVPWVFSTAVAVYRKKKDGTVTLIGISEWAQEILDKVYEY